MAVLHQNAGHLVAIGHSLTNASELLILNLVLQSRARQKDKKWITKGLRISISHKNKLLQRKIKRPTEYNIQTLKNYNIHLQQCLQTAEKNYYLEQVQLQLLLL